MAKKVAILDYGTGNLASLEAALKQIGVNFYLASNTKDLVSADALILPGVGHFHTATHKLKSSNLFGELSNVIKSGLPTLGICLGFHLLCQSSEEAYEDTGLGVIPLKAIRIKVSNTKAYKVPHMGWNNIEKSIGNSLLL